MSLENICHIALGTCDGLMIGSILLPCCYLVCLKELNNKISVVISKWNGNILSTIFLL